MIRHSYKTFKTQGDGPDKGMGQKGSLGRTRNARYFYPIPLCSVRGNYLQNGRRNFANGISGLVR
jgi:hypothetical protein